ncbi:MAG: hypothetical protein HZA77_10555 [Candidatus Schekmanbacteria bacterium]|nr:hypothetical protein [Candidatus Schekmanbacteria bacterium]
MKNYLGELWDEIAKNIKLEEINPFPDLKDFKAKGKKGEIVIEGAVQHFKSEKIEKIAYGRYLMTGVEINGVSIIPADNYDLPIFACNLSSTPRGINMDVDFYGTKDPIVNYNYLEKYYSPLKETYDEFLKLAQVKPLESDFFWSRTMRSPYFIKGLCPEPDSAPFINLSMKRLIKWLDLWKEAQPVKDEAEAGLIKKRKSMIRKVTAEGDPGKARYFDNILEDKNIIQRITDSMI